MAHPNLSSAPELMLAQHIDADHTMEHLEKHMQHRTASFTAERQQVHESIKRETLRPQKTTSGNAQKRPIACIIIGGIGEEKQLVDALRQKHDFSYINHQGLKKYLLRHDRAHNTPHHRGALQREAILLGQDIIHHAASHHKNMLINNAGLKKDIVQRQMDTLIKQGYDIELHWLDVDEKKSCSSCTTTSPISK